MAIKKIIVPTDFSETADTAAKFAVQLAYRFGVDVELVHVLNPATDLNNGYMIDPGIETVKRSKLTDLTAQIGDESQVEGGKVSVMSSFHLGFPIEEIVNISKEQEALIVVGATGESGVMDRVFGSIPVHLARRAHSPVLIIPRDAIFRGFSEIAYASAEAALDLKISDMLLDFANIFEARLHAVHIGKEDEYPIWEMEVVFKGQKNPREIIKKNVDRLDVVSALNQYCGANDIDLLIMATKHRKFWDSIIHTSMTREMALDPHLPLLVFHDDDAL